MIQVRGLRKSYKDVEVLKGVDFEVARGSIFALLGSNGAGKTTIVRILSTLLKPDGGTATVNGSDVVAAGTPGAICYPGRGWQLITNGVLCASNPLNVISSCATRVNAVCRTGLENVASLERHLSLRNQHRRDSLERPGDGEVVRSTKLSDNRRDGRHRLNWPRKSTGRYPRAAHCR